MLNIQQKYAFSGFLCIKLCIFNQLFNIYALFVHQTALKNGKNSNFYCLTRNKTLAFVAQTLYNKPVFSVQTKDIAYRRVYV